MYLKKAQLPSPQLMVAVRRPVPSSYWYPVPTQTAKSEFDIEHVNQALDADAAYWEFLARVDDHTRRQLDNV